MNTKDTYWFRHDSNAKDDFKCLILIEQLGCEGYGIFWILVETLRDQKNYKYPFALLGALSRKYNTTQAKMETVVKKYDLFEIDEKNFFFSLSFNNRMKALDEVKEKRRLAGKKSGEARRKKSNEHESNKCSSDAERLDKKRVEEKRKELNEIKKLILQKSTNELFYLYDSKEYKELFSNKILSKIEKDKGFSNLKELLEDDTYDEWVIKEFL